MEINSEKIRNCVVVSVKGKIDAVTSPDFEKSLSELIGKGEKIIVMDLGSLEYISSAGLRSILATAKHLKPIDGKLLFAGLQGPVKDVFRISGFASIFQIFDSRDEALQQL
ncbi:MAG: STAS domain-containing protein [Syntrophales bacterium]|nr:STAS domain-containing protein [Syntrophales bacterium]HPL63132.1 STAS domain-containing protein [Syntrophales bacterium]